MLGNHVRWVGGGSQPEEQTCQPIRKHPTSSITDQPLNYAMATLGQCNLAKLGGEEYRGFWQRGSRTGPGIMMTLANSRSAGASQDGGFHSGGNCATK